MEQLLADLSSAVDQRIVIAVLLGTLIGFERELSGKDPSIRTFALIALGSALFTVLSHDLAQSTSSVDPTRIAAQIVTGIGFIGAGSIFRSPRGVTGLTTAALMWTTAAIGMACGFGRIDLATTATVAALIITDMFGVFHRIVYALRRSPPPP